jgi:hypothetical protein
MSLQFKAFNLHKKKILSNKIATIRNIKKFKPASMKFMKKLLLNIKIPVIKNPKITIMNSIKDHKKINFIMNKETKF